jgi:formylglycine-generating enzyme required for sulfatase activity
MQLRILTWLGLACVACLVAAPLPWRGDSGLIREMGFVRVPKGSFWMGWDSVGKESRKVTIEHDFEIAAYCVTQSQWQALMGDNPSCYSRKGPGSKDVEKVPDDVLKRFPVEHVSWNEVQEFMKQLNAREQGKGWTYRLPSEAEWEYACRGAATTRADCEWDFYVGKRRTNDLSSRDANFDGSRPAGDAEKGPFLGRLAPVGSYPPNPLGLYDMHGNVSQWCDDLWRTATGTGRGIRGNYWGVRGANCRTASRRYSSQTSHIADVGFRLARARTADKK